METVTEEITSKKVDKETAGVLGSLKILWNDAVQKIIGNGKSDPDTQKEECEFSRTGIFDSCETFEDIEEMFSTYFYDKYLSSVKRGFVFARILVGTNRSDSGSLRGRKVITRRYY